MGLTDAQSAAVDEFLATYAPDDAPLVKALLTAGELSNGDPTAVSPKGARGLMQLTPIALKDIGRDPETFDYNNPAENLKAGIDYVRKLRTDYGLTNPLQIAAAYNAGPGTVQDAVRQGGVQYLPAETQSYVRRMAAALETPAETRRESPMPLMTDAADPVDRSPRDKAVDIPDAQSLVAQSMGAQRNALPWYAGLPQRILEPLAELEVEGARRLTGSELPRLSNERLATDAMQSLGLVAPSLPIGRVGSAVVQGASGAASALSDAAERHGTAGKGWTEQLAALDGADALNLGTQIVLGSTMGALFPGKKAAPFSPQGGIAQARRDLDTMMARRTAERALPPPRQGEVTAAFAKLDRNLQVDATAWRQALIEHGSVSGGQGKGIPNEVQAIANRLVPEMKTVMQPAGAQMQGHGLMASIPVSVPVQVPTGRYFATAGDLIDANKALGNMVNVPAARGGEVLGHSVGNLNALRAKLSAEISNTLPAQQRGLYDAARATAKDVAQDTAAMRRLERYMVPEEGLLNGRGLFDDLTNNAEKRIQQFGKDRYRQLLDFSRSVKDISKHPEKASLFRRAITDAVPTAAAIGGYAAAGVPGAVLPIAGRVLYGIATSQSGRRTVDALARAPLYSQTFLAALGRLSAARGLLGKQIEAEASPLAELGLAGRP